MKFCKKIMLITAVTMLMANVVLAEETAAITEETTKIMPETVKAPWHENTSADGIQYTFNYIKGIGKRNVRYATLNNGDCYYAEFIECQETGEYINGVEISGKNFSARYYDRNNSKWIQVDSILQMPETAHLYLIDTDTSSLIISMPTVYRVDDVYKTRVSLRCAPISVAETENGYYISYKLSVNSGETVDTWYLKSDNGRLVPFSDKFLQSLSVHDLDGKNKRWCYDGFYSKAATSYKPYIKDMFFRHPSNYVGVSWTKYAECRGFKDLAYIMMLTCVYNQNEEGFWSTYSEVDWLKKDFGINAGFYDTRFNSDFAGGLVVACQKFGDDYFRQSIDKYMKYYYNYAENHSHITKNGGILVEDYGNAKKKAHCSLNHQLAELNLLYEYYKFTVNNDYLLLANKMLRGVQDTKDYWVMPNNNLKYAYGYTGSANTMVDYPYLTYNDLYITKTLLRDYFNTSDNTIEYLMKCKKIYMDKNGITEYMK